MVMSVLHVGAIPDIDLNIDLTPVDYVAGAIVELSRNLECLGGTYQLLNDNPLSLKLMAEWLQARDRNVEIVTLDQWREGLASLVDSVPGEVLGLMSEILTPDAEVGLEHESLPAAFLLSFDCSNAHRGLAGSDVRCHPVNVELLDRYAAYLDKVGFLRLASV
jgi:thioester reductase-like protein